MLPDVGMIPAASWARLGLLTALAAPFLGVLALLLRLALLGWRRAKGRGRWDHLPRERSVARLAASALLVSLLGILGAVAAVASLGRDHLLVDLGPWYSAGDYQFAVVLQLDPPAMVLAVLAAVITGLVGRFSVTYLHREPGFLRFFLLLLLFAGGMQLLALAGTVDLLFAGWELVGLTSTLLIAFFLERKAPVAAARRAFVTYRIADVGLLLGAVWLHHWSGSSTFSLAFGSGHWPADVAQLPQGAALPLALLFIAAAAGKSAQLPLSGWLPRAMEGPTPSSALFYGALSVHAGVFLLLRIQPLLDQAPLARGALMVVGLATAGWASLGGRTQSDVKGTLALATLTQVGLMFAAIGLGWYKWALLHLTGHAILRAWQMLRAPSALRDANLRLAAGLHLRTGEHLERLFPSPAQRWLYALALQGFHLDALTDRWLVRPVMALAQLLDRLERRQAATVHRSTLGSRGSARPPLAGAPPVPQRLDPSTAAGS